MVKLTTLSFLAPKGAMSLRAAGDRARDRRRWGEAAKLYRSYLAEKPDDFEIWVQCGHAEKESGNFDGALHCYLGAQALRGDDADLHLQLGHLYKLMDREPDAIASYQRCLELNEGSADALRELASLLRPSGTPAHDGFSESQAPEFVAPAFEFALGALASESDLRAQIERERSKGNLVSVAILTRAYVRLSPRDTTRWEALAQALRQIGDEGQAKRCMAIVGALVAENQTGGSPTCLASSDR